MQCVANVFIPVKLLIRISPLYDYNLQCVLAGYTDIKLCIILKWKENDRCFYYYYYYYSTNKPFWARQLERSLLHI